MKQDKFPRPMLFLYVCGMIPVIWLALLLAPSLGGGLAGLIMDGGTVLDHPFHITICEGSLKTALIFVLSYGLGLGIFLSSDRNYRWREEHGSAKWGSANAVRQKYADKAAAENKILTQKVFIGLDGRKHRRNLNTLVCGGSGAPRLLCGRAANYGSIINPACCYCPDGSSPSFARGFIARPDFSEVFAPLPVRLRLSACIQECT